MTAERRTPCSTHAIATDKPHVTAARKVAFKDACAAPEVATEVSTVSPAACTPPRPSPTADTTDATSQRGPGKSATPLSVTAVKMTAERRMPCSMHIRATDEPQVTAALEVALVAVLLRGDRSGNGS